MSSKKKFDLRGAIYRRAKKGGATAAEEGSKVGASSTRTALLEAPDEQLLLQESVNLQVNKEDSDESEVTSRPKRPGDAAGKGPLGLSILSSGKDPVVDIIAIHGINGGSRKTWTAPNGVCWLRDLLKTDLPNARILTWGYDANTHSLSQDLNQQFLHDHSNQLVGDLVRKRRLEKIERRPIIFIVHSLGGIVLKEALLNSELARNVSPEDDRQISVSTYGIIFMGTPHSGSPTASLGQVLVNMAAVFGSADDRLLQHLIENSEFLQRQLYMYRNISANYETVYVYETLKTRIKGSPKMIEVVPQQSAIVQGVPNSKSFGIGANHSDLAKFASKDSDGYRNICATLQLWMRDAADHIQERWEIEIRSANGQGTFNIPFQLSDIPYTIHFVYRETEMQDIERVLRPGEDNTKRTIYVLVGLGGIGKTQLAAKFARDHKDHYSAIFWLNADSITSITASLAAQMSRLPSKEPNVSGPPDPEGRAKNVLKWLGQPHNTNWLLIYDNVDRKWSPNVGNDPESFDLNVWFPNCDHGSILITSRLMELAHQGQSRKLATMTEEEGLEILARNAGHQPIWRRLFLRPFEPRYYANTGSDMTAAKRLVSMVGGLPLALTQAGRYVHETGTTFDVYQKLYDRSWRELIENAPRLREYEDRGILTTWKISYDQIEKLDSNAAKFLQLWAYFDRQDIWFELLSVKSQSQPLWFQRVMDTRITFLNAIRLLLGYSMIESYSTHLSSPTGRSGLQENYSMHPVVHQWCLDCFWNASRKELFSVAIHALGSAIVDIDGREDWPLRRRLQAHYLQITHIIVQHMEENIVSELSPDDFTALTKICHHLVILGRPKEALLVLQIAANGTKRNLGDQDLSTTIALRTIGLAFYWLRKYDEAEGIFQQCLEKFRIQFGENNSKTVEIKSLLANNFASNGQLEDAQSLYMQVLEAYKQLLGLQHPKTLMVMINISHLLRQQEKFPEAEAMCRQALSAQKSTLGLDNADVFFSLQCLAGIVADQGDLGEASKLYQEALIGQARVLGPDHDETVFSRHSLAAVYRSQGRPEEVENLLREVLIGQERSLGRDHADTLTSIDGLARVLRDQGKLGEAENLYREVLLGKERTLSQEHVETLDSMWNLGTLLIQQGKLDEAEQKLNIALKGRQKLLGMEHFDTLMVVNDLGILYGKKRRLEEAETMFQRVYDWCMSNESGGSIHPQIERVLKNLRDLQAELYQKSSSVEEYDDEGCGSYDDGTTTTNLSIPQILTATPQDVRLADTFHQITIL